MDPTIVTQDTLVSSGVVLTSLGGVAWLVRLYMAASATRKDLSVLTSRVASLETKDSQTSERLVRLETKLDFIIEKLNAK